MNGVMAQRVAEGESYLTLGGHRNLVSGGGCEEFGKGHPRQRQSPGIKGAEDKSWSQRPDGLK